MSLARWWWRRLVRRRRHHLALCLCPVAARAALALCLCPAARRLSAALATCLCRLALAWMALAALCLCRAAPCLARLAWAATSVLSLDLACCPAAMLVSSRLLLLLEAARVTRVLAVAMRMVAKLGRCRWLAAVMPETDAAVPSLLPVAPARSTKAVQFRWPRAVLGKATAGVFQW